MRTSSRPLYASARRRRLSAVHDGRGFGEAFSRSRVDTLGGEEEEGEEGGSCLSARRHRGVSGVGREEGWRRGWARRPSLVTARSSFSAALSAHACARPPRARCVHHAARPRRCRVSPTRRAAQARRPLPSTARSVRVSATSLAPPSTLRAAHAGPGGARREPDGRGLRLLLPGRGGQWARRCGRRRCGLLLPPSPVLLLLLVPLVVVSHLHLRERAPVVRRVRDVRRPGPGPVL